MPNTKSVTSTSRPRPRRRRTNGGAANVRAFTPEPRRTVRASRRAYFELYVPRFTFNPWQGEREWRASRPTFFAGVFLVLLAIGLFPLFNRSTFHVDAISVTGNKGLTASELSQASGIQGWNIFFVDPRETAA